MSRHAKNPCSSAVFSHAERARLTYGTRERRGGLESQKIFNHCEICLGQAENAMICSKGHIFCKGCIYESLASQKANQKFLLDKYNKQQAAAEEEAKREQEKLEAKQREAFERVVQTTVTPAASSSSTSSSSSAPAGYVQVRTNNSTGVGYIVDRDLVAATSTATSDAKSRSYLASSPWIPSMAPSDVGEAKMTGPPPAICQCPGSNHPLKLKQLRPVKFHISRKPEEEEAKLSDEQRQSGKPICIACKKLLSNQTPMICLTRCGHVQCKQCVNTLILGKKRTNGIAAPSSSSSASSSSTHSTTTASQSLSCLECDDPCKEEDLVQIVAATGFAATGNVIAKSKLSPAFRC